ncbi:hypothetical protein DESC_610017 [Desulfosarcina cetonica]|nr:hypothetical protein DESC_610017 [Desulfosarcina cetonica]
MGDCVTEPPPHYLADTLVSALNSLEKPLVVVLEDFHTIASESVQTILSRMIQCLPDRIHLVIVTRVDPVLPQAERSFTPPGGCRGLQTQSGSRAVVVDYTLS